MRASEQATQKVVEQFFRAMTRVDDVKAMKETVSFPFVSVFVSPTEAYPLQIDQTEAEFVERFSQFAKSFERRPEELEGAKAQFAATTFTEFETTLQGDSAYVTCLWQSGTGHTRSQKLMSVLQQTKDDWRIVFTTLPT